MFRGLLMPILVLINNLPTKDFEVLCFYFSSQCSVVVSSSWQIHLFGYWTTACGRQKVNEKWGQEGTGYNKSHAYSASVLMLETFHILL